MNVVLYTRDMEPITIIDLPMWALDHGERLGGVNVAVMDATQLEPVNPTDPVPPANFAIVRMAFHRLRFYDKQSWIITVDNDELALKLKPSWLPGQRGAINEYQRITSELSRVLLDVLARGLEGL